MSTELGSTDVSNTGAITVGHRRPEREAAGPVWRNWGRSVSAVPARIECPGSDDEVGDLLIRAERDGLRVRPVGSGHSFTPIAATDGVLVRLEKMAGIRAVDHHTGEVRVGAGTVLRDLCRDLRRHGLGLANMGDIDTQTVAGAISTGTHGTGVRHTGLSAQVSALRLVLADGTALDCSANDHPDLFQAARLGLGAFGILTEVTLACPPAFLLAADEYRVPLDRVLGHFSDIVGAADHVEFYWFPHTATALVKSNRRLPVDHGADPLPRWRALWDDEVMSNGLFGLTCALGTVAPRMVPAVNAAAAALLSRRTYTDHAPAVFTSPRRVRFREMEYAIDFAALPAALVEIRDLIARNRWRISFPLEIRAAAADDVWLSTSSGRRSAYIAVHRYHREPFAAYFLAVEQILLRYGGRPHWGKLHTLNADQLRQRYPRFDEVTTVRDAVDPGGRFRNCYLDRVLGAIGA